MCQSHQPVVDMTEGRRAMPVGPSFAPVVLLVQVAPPVVRYPRHGTWYPLVLGVVIGWREARAGVRLLGAVVPEPVLARLVRTDHRVARRAPVCGGVLAR